MNVFVNVGKAMVGMTKAKPARITKRTDPHEPSSCARRMLVVAGISLLGLKSGPGENVRHTPV